MARFLNALLSKVGFALIPAAEVREPLLKEFYDNLEVDFYQDIAAKHRPMGGLIDDFYSRSFNLKFASERWREHPDFPDMIRKVALTTAYMWLAYQTTREEGKEK